jgi:hypothetical protein
MKSRSTTIADCLADFLQPVKDKAESGGLPRNLDTAASRP